MTPRIAILSGIQLSTNPRVVKEADTLTDAGYDVEVVGAMLDPTMRERDQELLREKSWVYTELVNAGSGQWREQLKWVAVRTRMRFWREAQLRFGIGNPRQLGYVAPEMLRFALAHPADLTIVHLPQALPVGAELIRRGNIVGVDMEDWYSEDLLPSDRRALSVEDLRRWEGIVLRGAEYATTTSHSLSEALATAYDCLPPAVVYNSFPWRERESIDHERRDRADTSLPSLCWFSQVGGPGRGLETLMDALSDVETQFEIHLRGSFSTEYKSSLLARAPDSWRERIYFHAQVSHAKLISRLAEHDIGLAGEIPYCGSRALTITNKMLQYILAGIPVLASDTAGQMEVAEIAKGAVFPFAAGEPADMAVALNRLLGNPAALTRARENALNAAENFFCWERSAPVLLEQVARALAERPKFDNRRQASNTSPA